MAWLYLDEVLGVEDASGTVIEILVTGSAPGLQTVRVAVEHDDQTLSRDPVPVVDGGWTASFMAGADFAAGDISCDEAILVTVSGRGRAIKSEAMFVRCVPERTCPRFSPLQPLTAQIAACDLNQMRLVPIKASIPPSPALTRGEVRVRGEEVEGEFVDEILWPPNETEATAEVLLPAGRRYTARVYTTTPDGCAGPSTTFTTPPCGCPVIDPGEHQVLADGRVSASATIIAGDNEATAELRLEADPTGPTFVIAPATSGSGTFTLEGTTETAVPAGSYWIVTEITEPSVCGGTRNGVTIGGTTPDEPDPIPDDREDPAPNGRDDDPAEGGGDNGRGNGEPTSGNGPGTPAFPWCLLGLLLAGFIAALGGIILGVALCAAAYISAIVGVLLALGVITAGATGTAGTVILVIIIVAIVVGIFLMFVGTVLLFLWLFTCGLCRVNCGLLVSILWVLGILMAVEFIIVAVAAALGKYLCALGWLISGMDLALINLVVLYVGAAAGCLAWPSFFPTWLRWRVPDSMRQQCR